MNLGKFFFKKGRKTRKYSADEGSVRGDEENFFLGGGADFAKSIRVDGITSKNQLSGGWARFMGR